MEAQIKRSNEKVTSGIVAMRGRHAQIKTIKTMMALGSSLDYFWSNNLPAPIIPRESSELTRSRRYNYYGSANTESDTGT